jgi:hypothetical protein
MDDLQEPNVITALERQSKHHLIRADTPPAAGEPDLYREVSR